MHKWIQVSGLFFFMSVAFATPPIQSHFRWLDFSFPVPADHLQKLIDPPANATTPNTWIGGDVATSIDTGRGRYVWLFGDTVLGTSQYPKRIPNKNPPVIVPNSVGIMHCTGPGKCSAVKKYIGTLNGEPAAIFQPQQIDENFWVLSGVMLQHQLLLAALRVPKQGKIFNVIGTSFILVSNPQDPPTQWQYQVTDLSDTNHFHNWTSGMIRTKDWIYIFGETGDPLSPHTIVSRIAVDQAEKGNFSAREFYVGNNTWNPHQETSFFLRDLPGSTELSFYYNPLVGWYTVVIAPFAFHARLYFTNSTSFLGRWYSVPIYSVLKPWSSAATSSHRSMYMVYAPKVHPELAKNINQLVFSYNININQFYIPDSLKLLFTQMQSAQYAKLYVPQMVEVLVLPGRV